MNFSHEYIRRNLIEKMTLNSDFFKFYLKYFTWWKRINSKKLDKTSFKFIFGLLSQYFLDHIKAAWKKNHRL